MKIAKEIDWAVRRPDPLLHLLQHALGLDDYGRGTMYRNHFVIGQHGRDWDLLNKAVADGLAARHDPREIFGGDYCFTVTDTGKKWVRENSPVPPKLSRAQKTFQEFMDEDGGETFGEWLKRREARRKAGFV